MFNIKLSVVTLNIVHRSPAGINSSAQKYKNICKVKALPLKNITKHL